ncbi:MAG: hypothetical protein WCJ58_00330 [bacterium]
MSKFLGIPNFDQLPIEVKIYHIVSRGVLAFTLFTGVAGTILNGCDGGGGSGSNGNLNSTPTPIGIPLPANCQPGSPCFETTRQYGGEMFRPAVETRQANTAATERAKPKPTQDNLSAP